MNDGASAYRKSWAAERSARAYHYAVIVVCALLVTLPLFLNGPSCGHDFDFHLQSWFAANQGWRSTPALLYPHWVPAANYGAGEPRFVFYPPLSWAFGALLGEALPWTLVSQAFTFLALAGCGLAFYRLARSWVRGPVAAAVSCVYLANPYLLFVAYERTAFGELLGAVFMPLAVLYALSPRPPVVRLALVVAALWFTNAPAAVMGCYLVAFCAASAALAARSIMGSIRSLIALALGTGMASVYVLPAWYEQRWVEIARVTGPGMRVEDSFLFAHTGEVFHDQVLHTASWLAVMVVGAGLLSAALGWIAMREAGGPRPAVKEMNRERWQASPDHLPMLYVSLIVGLIAILLLLLPVSEPAWKIAPELRFLQFPWRWLLVASVLAALAVAISAESLIRWRSRSHATAQSTRLLPSRGQVISVVLMGLSLAAGAWGAGYYAQHSFGQSCDEEDNVRAQEELLASPGSDAASLGRQLPSDPSPAGFEGTDEYTPSGAENGEIQQGLPVVRLLPAPGDDEGDDSANPNPPWNGAATSLGTVRVTQWTPEHKRLVVTTPRPLYAVLRLMDYPAWLVRRDGTVFSPRPQREDGLLTIPVPAGRTTIDVSYRATADVYAGRLLPLISLGALAGWACRSRRRQPLGQAPART